MVCSDTLNSITQEDPDWNSVPPLWIFGKFVKYTWLQFTQLYERVRSYRKW